MIVDIVKKATGGIDGLVDDLVKTASDKIKQKVSEAFSIHKLKSLKDNIEVRPVKALDLATSAVMH
jgi:hypothetical protein